MKRVISPILPEAGKPVQLPESEARHAIQVLRLRNGQSVEVMDGKGKAVIATLQVRGKNAYVELSGQAPTLRTHSDEIVPLTLEMAVVKGDAMEWVVEKAVELGVQSLVPVLTAHTVVQVDRKGPKVFQERWQKIADQALKQCGRLQSMNVLAPVSLEELLKETASGKDTRFWCDETSMESAPLLADWLLDRKHSSEKLRLLIGPEGGWGASEIELLSRSAERVSLGPLILRAETAAISAISVIASYYRSKKWPK